MDIPHARHDPNNADYQLECQEALDLHLAQVVDQAIIAGWEPRNIFQAIETLARNQALAYEEDPDPTGE